MARLLTFCTSTSGKSVTKLAKTLAIAACAALLSAGVIGSAHHAYAQDADAIDQNAGAWSGPDAGSADESSRQTKVHPLDIKGCWSGDIVDTADGTGTGTFQFDQNSNLKKLKVGSIIHLNWTDGAYARVPLKGTVSSTGFIFNGNAGAGCLVTGFGSGDDSAMTGTVVFDGACATFFQDVTFSIIPGCS